MSVLVTGGAGFIGAEVVRELVARGDETVHVTSHSGALQRLEDLAGRVEVHALDLADTDAVASLIARLRPRAVYHFGAMLSAPGEADHEACIRTNAYGTHALLEACRLNGTRQVIFASSLGVFAGSDMPRDVITDQTAQHPDIVYGVTKVFGELLGRYYRRAHGLDFRGIRYPAIVGPGITTWSTAQYTSWAIERSARGEPFTIWAPQDYAISVLYYKEAGRAAVQLADAPVEDITTVNYVIGGVAPIPNAGRIAELVREKIPGARIGFELHPTLGHLFANGSPAVDDSCARAEWGWSPQLDYAAMIDDMLVELRAGG
jgi:threonine 3-dehydrogenase